MSLSRRLRSYFFRGLAVLLPTVLTISLFYVGYGFIKDNISVYINRGLVRLTMLIKGLEWSDPSNEAMREVWSNFWIEGWGSIAGFLIALVAVCIVGALLASVVGKTLWRMTEKFIMNTPFLRRVYPYIKQITDFVLTQEEQKKMFSRVVAVEYPRKGIWSICFVTGSGIQRFVVHVKNEILKVIITT